MRKSVINSSFTEHLKQKNRNFSYSEKNMVFVKTRTK